MKIKFISLNLFEGGILFDNVFDFLDKEKPDVVALQEVYDGKDIDLPKNLRSLEVLKEHFKSWDYHFAPEFLLVRDEGKIEIGNAIFSKFPINKTITKDFGIPYGEHPLVPPDGDFSTNPRNIQCCEVEVNKKTINVCNLHGIWGLSGEDSPERLKMSEVITDLIQDKDNVILAGDFNLRPNTKTIENIEKHLTNIFKDELATSFNLKRKNLEKFPGYATSVVDMIFASKDLKIIFHNCPQVDVSDHLPLICEFEI